jgi:hypothetical protein
LAGKGRIRLPTHSAHPLKDEPLDMGLTRSMSA